MLGNGVSSHCIYASDLTVDALIKIGSAIKNLEAQLTFVQREPWAVEQLARVMLSVTRIDSIQGVGWSADRILSKTQDMLVLVKDLMRNYSSGCIFFWSV